MRKTVLFVGMALLMGPAMFGQCAMCRAVLETEDNGKQAEAVNDGIVYLMVWPYLLVAVIGYAIYRTRVKSRRRDASL